MVDTNNKHWINQKEISYYLADVRKHQPITKDEENVLLDKIYKYGCEESKNKLILSNIRYVITMAKKYQNQGMDLADLIAEGNYGLLKAADRYNYKEKKVRFLSYAIWWIKQSILHSLYENGRLIRIPANVINELYKYNKLINDNTNTNIKKSDKLLSIPKISKLDSPVTDDYDFTLVDVIENKNADRPDINFGDDDQLIKDELNKIMSKLTDLECDIVCRYYGLNDYEPHTLQDISDVLGITKERVRQIKHKSIKKLRYYSMNFFDLM